MFLLFGAFIVACGFTHFMEALAPFAPLYRLGAMVKLVTALVSWGTVICLIPLIPKALALRSPAELEAINLDLQKAIDVGKRAEEALRKVQGELEQRVHMQTAELPLANVDLRKEIAERKRAEEQVLASLHEKEVLLKEIHHRVKNNLAVISSLFYLQSTYAHDVHSVQMFRESQDRVRSMALVHESLYRSENLAEVDFAEYARSLAANLFRSYCLPQNNVRLKTNIQQVTLSIETAVPCGLILNELISNCLKHAFPSSRQGEVNLNLQVEEEGRCRLKVSDDGVGMPAGLDVMNCRTLGLRLVRSLTGQIDGDIEFHDHQPGTEAQLTFPMKNGHERS
jgi:two-component sensor histidine kinase